LRQILALSFLALVAFFGNPALAQQEAEAPPEAVSQVSTLARTDWREMFYGR